MSPQRIAELYSVFEGFTANSLGSLNEKVCSKATWDELKLFLVYSQFRSMLGNFFQIKKGFYII
jgi:hypothetical protein